MGASNGRVNSLPRESSGWWTVNAAVSDVHVRQMPRKRIGGVMRAQRSHDDRQRLGPDLAKVRLTRRGDGESQPLDRRRKLRDDVRSIATRIDPIPAGIWKPHGVQSVKAEGCSGAIKAQALIAESCRQSIGSEQRSQEVTLRITESAAFPQDL